MGDSVVVGIDGSAAAVHAAHWAVDEAAARDVPLRLVSCTPLTDKSKSPGTDRLATEYAATSLRAALAAIEDDNTNVKMETALLDGDPSSVLIEESRHAAMVCVGSVGIGRVARAFLGSTAAEVAEGAFCPVAVIRGHAPHQPNKCGSIVVQVDDSADNDRALTTAVAEAQTHAMPIIAVGECPPTTGISAGDELMRRTATLQTLHPDVEITAVPITTGIPQFVESHPAPIQLVVLGAANAGALSTLIGAHDRHDHHEFSVVVVHP
jgi:nucleotide-binding universal stress UspA family protein